VSASHYRYWGITRVSLVGCGHFSKFYNSSGEYGVLLSTDLVQGIILRHTGSDLASGKHHQGPGFVITLANIVQDLIMAR
jgi:hypothetical protein